MRRLALVLALGLAAPAGAAGDESGQGTRAAFEAWIEGDWMDPRVHRCGRVHVRIRVDGALLQFDTVTFGNAVPGAVAEILEIEADGSAILYNALIGREQRVRYVTADAHVLERPDGSGGVTFVRCETGDGAGG